MKRLLSLILSLALAVSMFSGITVFAREMPAGEASAEADELTARLAEEEQRRAEEEAHRAEVERRRAEEEQRLAEEEKRREEEKNRRDESLRAMGIEPDKKLDPDNLPTRPPIPGDGEVTAADSGYSEVVYISTPEELMAIDGHDGGYYELQNDIDITGIEWKPLTLYNATFNGNNYAINGLTITKESDNIGFLSVSGYENNNYIFDLNLTDININVTIKNYFIVKILGDQNNTFVDTCSVEGDLKVKIDSLNQSTNISAIENGVNCVSRLNMDISGVTSDEDGDYHRVDFSALTNCVDSENYGDLLIDISSSPYDNISVLSRCTNCQSYGSTKCDNVYIYGMYNCTDCEIRGNITSINGGVTGIYGGVVSFKRSRKTPKNLI